MVDQLWWTGSNWVTMVSLSLSLALFALPRMGSGQLIQIVQSNHGIYLLVFLQVAESTECFITEVALVWCCLCNSDGEHDAVLGGHR